MKNIITKLLLGMMTAILVYHGGNVILAATIYLEPSSGTLIRDCSNPIDIKIDTQGEEIIGAAVYLSFDHNILDVGGLYVASQYNLPVETVITPNGLESSQLSLIRDENGQHIGFEGVVDYGTLLVTNDGNINDGTEVNIEFIINQEWFHDDGTRIFSIVDASNILTETVNGSYTFIDGQCNTETNFSGANQLAAGFDVDDVLVKNLEQIGKEQNEAMKLAVGNKYNYNNIKHIVQQYYTYILIGLLLLIIILILYTRHHKKSHK